MGRKAHGVGSGSNAYELQPKINAIFDTGRVRSPRAAHSLLEANVGLLLRIRRCEAAPREKESEIFNRVLLHRVMGFAHFQQK